LAFRRAAGGASNNNSERRPRGVETRRRRDFVKMTPHKLSAVELIAAYRARKLSPVEAMKDVLGRVARYEPHIKATYLLNPERALADAKASEARWLRGEPLGPLDGVPTTVKDNVPTKG
jgi:amidase/aspartyl-tRNA(Asn)/glutamyl-tRNA(Gln) amidotransferase subunit A